VKAAQHGRSMWQIKIFYLIARKQKEEGKEKGGRGGDEKRRALKSYNL
jgi:hypothetical protein